VTFDSPDASGFTTTEYLPRDFFEQASDVVAAQLVGAYMDVRDQSSLVRVRVVETEAYGGLDDPASHAFRGPTPRAAIMFGPAGFLYVYLSYGIHWCMNVVTGIAGTGSAVLLRACEIIDDAPSRDDARLLRGPGNLTKGLRVTGDDNGVDCCQGATGRISFRASDAVARHEVVGRSERIGLSRERERLSRYFLEGSAAVSKQRAKRS
jgi:DNA-3-methyladenine glycosylase